MQESSSEGALPYFQHGLIHILLFYMYTQCFAKISHDHLVIFFVTKHSDIFQKKKEIKHQLTHDHV